MSGAFTFYFDEIFPSYDEWQEFISSTGIVNYENQLEANFDRFVYKILMREFTHQNIRYFEVDSFKCELANVYESKFHEFMKQKELIDAMYQLSLDDFTLLQTTLSNIANNPNDEPSDPKEPLNFISGQTYSQLKSNKLQSYLYALNNLPSLNFYKFINRSDEYDVSFRDLFMNVQPIDHYLFRKGE